MILERSGESNPLDMNVYKKKFIRNKYLKDISRISITLIHVRMIY